MTHRRQMRSMASTKRGGWKHSKPAQSVQLLTKAYGPPLSKSQQQARWENIDGFQEVVIKDESIPHNFPANHIDYMYGVRKIKVPAHLHDNFARITGSIHIDALKGIVTARCQTPSKNAATLGFVERGVRAPSLITKAEYSRVILEDLHSPWYPNLTKGPSNPYTKR